MFNSRTRKVIYRPITAKDREKFSKMCAELRAKMDQKKLNLPEK